MSTQWDDAGPWGTVAWQPTDGWRQNQQYSMGGIKWDFQTGAWTFEAGAGANQQYSKYRSMELSRVRPHDSADAMDGSLQVDLPLDNREVLVDHQNYTIPKPHNEDTWAEREWNQHYVVWITIGGKTGSWCRLCGKWAECKSHFKGKDHLAHVLQPSKLFMDANLWKIPKTVQEHQQEQQQQTQRQESGWLSCCMRHAVRSCPPAQQGRTGLDHIN